MRPRLAAFYIRNADKKKEYAEKAAKMTKEFFPDGMTKFNLADLHEAPKKGVQVTNSAKYLETRGLFNDRIIVGLNGYKTDNVPQFNVVQYLSLNPDIKTTYWDGTKYSESLVKTVICNRMNIGIRDYPLNTAK